MLETNTIPELRFPEFEGDWNKRRFGNLYSFKTTNSYSRDKLNYESGIVKNIHYGDIHTRYKALFDASEEVIPFINEGIEISRIPSECYINEGDLVIADASENYNDIGKTIEIINLNNERVVAGLHTFLARKESKEITIGFAAFLMMSRNVRMEVMRIAQGTKVLGISSKRFAHIPLLIPRPEEQQKIASFLAAVDKRIQLLKRKKEQLQEYKKGVMQKLFSLEIRFKDEAGNDFPDWEEKRLGSVANISKGKQLNRSELNETGEYPCQNGGVEPSGFTNKYNTVANTITISEGGNSSGYVNYMTTKFWCGGHCYALLDIKESAMTQYLYHYLKHNQTRIMSLRVGSGLPNIQKADLAKIKVMLPSLEEQSRIGSSIDSLGKVIEVIENEIRCTVNFKNGLLQKMFV